MTRLLAAAAALVALAPLSPAHADSEPTVWVTYSYHSVPLDAGYLVFVVCEADAVPGTPTQVAVATDVRCSVGLSADKAAYPGGQAVTVLAVPVVGSATVCVSGDAAFVDPVAGHVFHASSGSQCDTLVP